MVEEEGLSEPVLLSGVNKVSACCCGWEGGGLRGLLDGGAAGVVTHLVVGHDGHVESEVGERSSLVKSRDVTEQRSCLVESSDATP